MTRPSVVAAGIAATLVAGLGLVGPAADAATPVGRAAVRFHGTKNHSVSAPDHVRPGIVHLRSSGNSAVLLVRAERAGEPKSDLVKAVKSTSPKNFLKHYRFVAESQGRSDSFVRLTRGTYYFVNADGIKAAKIATMTVSGSRVDAKLPASRRVVVTKHRHLTTPGSVPARTFLHLINNSSAFTNLLFIGTAKDATYKSLRDLVDHPTLQKVFDLAFDGDMATFSAAGPKSESWQHFHGKPGRYVFAVLAIPNHGQPKVHRGQVRIVKVK